MRAHQLVSLSLVILMAAGALWLAVHVVRTVDTEALTVWLASYRQAWYALPIVLVAFVALGLVPVVLLIAATGVAFGPVLGPLYAMAGCLTSASVGFAIGRRMGRRRVERLGGARITRLTRALKRNGTLAVFLVRKVPAPFALANIVIGASSVAYRDFVIGTLLGMGAFVVAVAGFGYHATRVFVRPTPGAVAAAALMVAVPLMLAWLVNRTLRPVEA